MSLLSIQQALDAKLSALIGIGDIILEGVPYTPSRNRPYVISRISAYTAVPGGYGRDAVILVNGAYQINVVRPATEGKGPAGQVAALLVRAFSRSTVVTTTDGIPVSLVSASEMPAIDGADWQIVPVTISFTGSYNNP